MSGVAELAGGEVSAASTNTMEGIGFGIHEP
jgi:hypothetical protein